MRPADGGNGLADLRGAVQLAGDGFDRITAGIHEFHRAIADQPFGRLAPLPGIGDGAQPVRLLHDGITDGVYAAVRLTGAAVFGAAAALLRRAERMSPPTIPAAASPARDIVAGAVSGFFGDHAARQRNPLAPRLGFYERGRRLPLTREALATAFPQAGAKLVVFVHGLACTEHAWQLYVDAQRPDGAGYGPRLTAELGHTALYVRYNSGLHISKNGDALVRQLARLVAAWPVAVEHIALVGHSMGGLVIRCAAARAHARGETWTQQLRQVVCLGSPHRGAPLEKAVHGLTQVLDAFDLSRPWGRALDVRSVGIRDLRHGATSQADWRDGARRHWRPPQPIARVPHARYHFVGSSIGLSASDLLGQWLGDGLVRLPSSLAAELADADTATLFGLHHMQLLNHPQVYAQLRAVLAAP